MESGRHNMEAIPKTARGGRAGRASLPECPAGAGSRVPRDRGLASAAMQNAEERKIPRASGRLFRANVIVLTVLAVWMTIFGADKSPATRALQRLLSRARSANVVTAEDVAHGWRVVSSAEAERPVEMPAGTVTNELLRRRGGFDWAFRVEPEGWRSSWRGQGTGLESNREIMSEALTPGIPRVILEYFHG